MSCEITTTDLKCAPLDGLRRLARSLGVLGKRKRCRSVLVKRVLAALERDAAAHAPIRGGWS